jgi:hypothetical protein
MNIVAMKIKDEVEIKDRYGEGRLRKVSFQSCHSNDESNRDGYCEMKVPYV